MSDIWALGCILYEMCALQQAWNGSNLLGLVYKIVQEKYPPVPAIYSEDLKRLVGNMLSKDPIGRPTLPQILALPFIRARMQQLFQAPTTPAKPARPLSGTLAAPPAAAPAAAAHATPSQKPPISAQRTPPSAGRSSQPAIGRASSAPRTAAASPSQQHPAPAPPQQPPVRQPSMTPPVGTRGVSPPPPVAASKPFGRGVSVADPFDVAAGGGAACGGATGACRGGVSPMSSQPRAGGECRGVAEASGAAGGVLHATPSAEPTLPSPGLTPKQRMQQRKQREADRRSLELKQASANAEQEKVIARRLGQLQFSSELSNGCVPSDRPSASAIGDNLRSSLRGPLPAPDGASSAREVEEEVGSDVEEDKGMGGTARPLSGTLQGTVRRARHDGGVDEYAVGATSQRSSLTGTTRMAHAGEGAGLHDTMHYEDDFEDDAADDDDSSTSQNPTVVAARQQAEARTLAQQDAQQQRLLMLAREHFNAPTASLPAEEVPEELPPPPRTSMGGMRHAALQERCRQALGDLFIPVYSYLRAARAEEAEEREVRKKLLTLVGRECLNDCMCVDELIFTEQLQPNF